MPLGVTVTTSTARPTRGSSTQIDTLFLAGPAGASAPATAREIRSIADFVRLYGTRVTENAASFDYLDNYFREGGRRAFFVKYIPGAVNVAAALDLFGDELGVGQVAVASETPGVTVYGALQNHAAATGRVALRDVAADADLEDLADAAELPPALNAEYGATFAPWVTIPAPSGVVGGQGRSVPASSTVAALIARADALGNPNRAAAGVDFPLQYATGLALEVTDADRETLLDAGLNTFARRSGVLVNYGFQTSIVESEDTPFWQFNCSRARMWLVSRAREVGEPYVFKPIDAQGRLARALQTDIDAVCLELYNVDGLYGETPADAFFTEVGASVNTEGTTARGLLNATTEARFGLHAKAVQIALISIPVTGRVTQV